jgi:hypothetical protein
MKLKGQKENWCVQKWRENQCVVIPQELTFLQAKRRSRHGGAVCMGWNQNQT